MTENEERILCYDGPFFPLFDEQEEDWPPALRLILYFCGLAWCFLGVSIIADIFMMGIEAVTSKKIKMWDKQQKKQRTVKIWNATIANLTLMALGSSAPEIMLNVVELFALGFKAGPLGPGTIVGSAAFNLLGIAAVCVVSIPSPEIRYIEDVTVYSITAFFSVFAYLWLIIILMVITPDRVDVIEAIITFLMFPLLVSIAFCADKGYIGGSRAVANARGVQAAEMSRDELAGLIAKVRAEWGDLDDDTVMTIIERETAARPSKAAYRYMANQTVVPQKKASEAKKNFHCGTRVAESSNLNLERISEREGTAAVVEFASATHSTKENVGEFPVRVQRSDDMSKTVKVRYRTVDGSAKSGSDFEATTGELIFEPNKEYQDIRIKIMDDEEWEGHEEFYVDLFEPESSDGGRCVIGPNYRTQVAVIDDDDPGLISFDKEAIIVEEHAYDYITHVRIIRRHGSKGVIKCRYFTEDVVAIAGPDYGKLDDTLTFQPGEGSCDIPVLIKARGRYESPEEDFRLILSDPVGTRFDDKTDGGKSTCICTITIRDSVDMKERTDVLASKLRLNWDKTRLGTSNWKDQFRSALYVGGDPEIQKNAHALEWLVHIVSFPFKLLFASVPPPDFADGKLCFVTAIAFVGFLTVMISDLANLLGCVLDIQPEITAITFVAIGTSLPDTLASRSAAVQDEFADASITNITGSNSVNVFLGLGMPWTIGSIYWAVKGSDEGFVVRAGNLGNSVCAFCGCAVACITCLAVRRKLFGGELGGPKVPKILSGVFLFGLWIVYICVSILMITSSTPNQPAE